MNRKGKTKDILQFVWEELNLIQVLKAVTQWLILFTLLYIAFKMNEAVQLIRTFIQQ